MALAVMKFVFKWGTLIPLFASVGYSSCVFGDWAGRSIVRSNEKWLRVLIEQEVLQKKERLDLVSKFISTKESSLRKQRISLAEAKRKR